LIVIALLLAIGAPAAPKVEAIPDAGPILAGDRVVWSVSPDEEAQLRVWERGQPVKTVYRVGPSTTKRDWALSDLAASGSRVGFNRSWTACPPSTPKKPKGEYVFGPDCYRVGADTVAGDIGASFGVLPRKRCPNDRSGDFDVDGDVVAYIETNCGERGPEVARVVALPLDGGRSPTVLREAKTASSTCCEGARLAHRFLAWSEGTPPRTPSVVVHDLHMGGTSYRADPTAAPDYSGRIKFDVQRDGKLLVAEQMPTRGVMFARLAWFSPAEPRAHVLPFQAYISEDGNWDGVRLAHDAFLFERLLDSGRSALVITDLKGQELTRLATFRFPMTERWGDYDFDGNRAVWSERRTTKTSAVHCPPGFTNCPIREDGWITIFDASRSDGWQPRPIARAPFTFYTR
jgi:hypothetical protein